MDRLNSMMLDQTLNAGIFDFSDYSAFSTLSRIIIEAGFPNFNYKNKNRFGLMNSYKLAYEFFSFIDPLYASYFEERFNSGDVCAKYFKKNSPTDQIALSYLGRDGTKKIYFPYGRNILDCFSLVHEILHDMNLDAHNLTVTRSMFTEYISIYGEYLLYEYVRNTYGIDFSADLKYTYRDGYKKAIIVDFQLALIKEFLEKSNINYYDVARIINSYDQYFRGILLEIFYNNLDKGELNIWYEIRYVIAVLLLSYTRDLEKTKKFDIDMFKFLNENINYLYPNEVYSMLDLDVSDEYTLSLSQDSYQKLRKSYSKYMR